MALWERLFRQPTLLGFASLMLFAVPNFSDVKEGNFRAEFPGAKSGSKPSEKRSSYPFSGELASSSAQSIVLKGKRQPRVLLLTAQTRILRNGLKARLEDAGPGERVTGAARKNAEGLEEALTVNLKGTEVSK